MIQGSHGRWVDSVTSRERASRERAASQRAPLTCSARASPASRHALAPSFPALSLNCPHCASSLRVPSLRPLFLCHLSSVTGLVKTRNPRVDLRWRRPGRRLRRGACLRLHARVRQPAALPPPGRLLHHDHGVSALRHLCTRAPPSYSPHTARSQLECKLVKWEAEGSLMAMYSKVRVSSGGGCTECVR